MGAVVNFRTGGGSLHVPPKRWGRRALLLTSSSLALFLVSSRGALADCSPAAANNVTATCSGTTLNQGSGAPGTSADPSGSGYGTGAQTGVTVNILAGGGNTITGTNYGIYLLAATVTNNAGASVTGGAFGIYGGVANVTNSGSVTGTSNFGIYAFTNATVTNSAGASIVGGQTGIYAQIGTANVNNSGSITGNSAITSGIYAGTDATVTNNAGGDITGGYDGIRAENGSANVTNSGTITGSGDIGIFARTDASVTNNSGASITGFSWAIVANNGSADVTNSGSISGLYGIFAPNNKVTVTNSAGGNITGSIAAIVAGGGGSSVFNAGTISGAIQFSGVGNTLTLAPGSVITSFVSGTGGDTFQLGGTGSATFAISQLGGAGSYSGFGTFNKIDTSIWTLTGTSTFSGPINVNGGTLNVNGNVTSASGVTVNAGGLLGGNGTIGNTSVAGGTFMPGDGTAGSSMSIAGTLDFSSASTYAVFVNPTTSSFAAVSGTAFLADAGVKATFANGSYIAKQYTIMTYGSRVGSFGTLTTSNLPANFAASLSYGATSAFLDLTLNLPTTPSGPNSPSFGSGLSRNQQGVGNALVNYFNTTGGIPAVYGSLTANGLTQASGQPGASTAQSGINATGQFINTVFDNAFDQNSTGGPLGFAAANDNDDLSAYAAKPKSKVATEAAEAFARAMPVKAFAPTFAGRWNVWASVYGGNSRVAGDSNAGTNTTTSRIFGTAVGATYRFTPDTQAGFALGGAGSSFDVTNGFGGGKADVFNAAVYAKHNLGSAYVAGLLGYSWQDTTTDRTVTISGTDRLHASLRAQALAARLEGGWRYGMLPVAVTPYTALQSTAFYLPSYAESATSGGSAFALSYSSKTVTATRGELGAKFDKAMRVQGGTVTLKAKSAWAHDWNTDRSATATFQSLPGATFVVNGASPSANAALLSLGGEMKWNNGWTLGASFDGEFSRTTTGYTGKGTLRYAW